MYTLNSRMELGSPDQIHQSSLSNNLQWHQLQIISVILKRILYKCRIKLKQPSCRLDTGVRARSESSGHSFIAAYLTYRLYSIQAFCTHLTLFIVSTSYLRVLRVWVFNYCSKYFIKPNKVFKNNFNCGNITYKNLTSLLC